MWRGGGGEGGKEGKRRGRSKVISTERGEKEKKIKFHTYCTHTSILQNIHVHEKENKTLQDQR